MKIEQCLFVDGAGNESTIDYELSPSDKMKGDWDLTNFNYKTIDNPMNALKKKLGFYRMCTHSYLHRINDTLIVEYYKLKKESDYANALLIAEKLITDNPDDHHVRILYLRALMDVKEVTKLEERLSLWEQELINSHFPYISDNVLTCRNILRALKYSQKGKNASDLAVVIFKPETDLEQRLKQFPGFLKYDVFLMPYDENPHFFDMQMTLKAFRAKSYFMMLSGEKEKSLRLLTTMYHLSRLINTGNRESMFFIGSGFRQIAVDGLLLYSINCCETEEDMYLFWEYLKKIEHSPAESFIPTHAEYMRESKSGELKKFVEKHEKEAQERSKSADAKFYLVQMATAAKRCLIINGHFPKTYEDYKPFLTNGPPTDPFHNGPLSSIIEDDKMICYSRGAKR